MPSPDATPYVDLRLFDKDAQDVFEAAKLNLQSYLPEWAPNEGNTEVLLLEALALEVSEAIFAINRLPGTVTEVLLRLYGVLRDLGAAPTTTLTFTLSDTAGHDLPAGVRAALVLPGGEEALVFSTTGTLQVLPGASTGTVAAVADRNTAAGNGVSTGTPLQLLDAIVFVERVALGSNVVGGADEETDTQWFDRGVTRFSRLVETLVLPRHFVAAALERPEVERALALDNYSPDLLATPGPVTATASTTGGTLAAGTYSYRVSALNRFGETVASAAVTATTTGTTGSVLVDWPDVVATGGAGPVTGYRVYGRVGGSEGLIGSTDGVTTQFTDTGAAAPGAAPVASNTTGGPVGGYPGHVTVAVYGAGGFLTQAQRDAIDAAFEEQAQANLAVHIVDPTITAVNVTTTVRAKTGFSVAAVTASVTAALDAYLSPDTWQWAGTVYRNELIALIDGVPGVDRVVSLTAPNADRVLNGVAPLADLGVATITVELP